MPLHVNLYHEVQQQELARRRDPLRLGMLLVLLVAIGFVVNYFIVLERSHAVGIRLAGLQGDWAKIEPKAKEAKALQDKLNADIQASDAMIKNVDSRFYLAPILDDICKTVPRCVQLTHVGADSPADPKVIFSVLSISGISSSAEPRKEAESVRTALNARLTAEYKQVTSVFKTLDDSDQYVMLDGHRMPTALFTMEFQIQTRDPVVVAPPPAHKSKGVATE